MNLSKQPSARDSPIKTTDFKHQNPQTDDIYEVCGK